MIALFTATYIYLGKFAQGAELNRRQVISQISQGLRQPIKRKQVSFLVLGLDKREQDNSMLTDTILIATINHRTGDYLLFSLPRDLYLTDLRTKINALYYYGYQQNVKQPTQLVKAKLEQILKTEIDYTIMLTMEDIKELIDFLGGVKINVEQGFVDNQFPKDDGSGEVMTISFKKGNQNFDGERALQYMRSRKGDNENENTDIARQERQKEVLLALKSKLLSSQSLILQPKKLGRLYKFINEKFNLQPELDLKEITTLAKNGFKLIRGKQVEAQLPWQLDNENQILVDTYEPVHNTWILVPENNDWEIISDYYQQQLQKIQP